MKVRLLSFVLILLFVSTSLAQIPKKLNYQGVLTDNIGNPLTGNQTLTLKLYDVVSGGSALWEETQEVVVDAGVFNVILGEVTPLNLPFNEQYWLGITVSPSSTELSPRIQLTAVAYSMNSLTVSDTSISPWQTSGNNLYYDGGKVFIGRTTGITLNEHFGFTAPTTADVYGGMYINTSDDLGKPFYGYSTNGNFSAWHYYQPADSTWRLFNAGDKITVKGNGIIGFDGRVGFRNTTPVSDIHLTQSDGLIGGTGGMTFARSTFWKIMHTGSHFSFVEDNVRRAYIETGTGSYVVTSDRNLKKDIEPIGEVLNKVLQLNPVKFNYTQGNLGKPKTQGFIAQEVGTLFPEIVKEDEDGYKGLAYDDFAILAIKAIQEQQKIIEDLQKQIDDLKSKANR